MENVAEALKIAFAIMMFIMALSLSISSISQANSAVTAIIGYNDRETNYSYVEPSSSNRTVGVETIIPTMYKAYKENLEMVALEIAKGNVIITEQENGIIKSVKEI